MGLQSNLDWLEDSAERNKMSFKVWGGGNVR